MSIVTQCPSCGTTFRVTPPQLQAQHGMVRCGRCAQVFDGFKTLATQPDTTQQETARENLPVMEIAAPVPAEPAAPPATDAAPAMADTVIDEPPTQTPAPVAAIEPQPFAPSTFTVPEPEPELRRHGGGWALGIVLMLVGLAAQGAYFYRSDLAASVPEARPLLDRMCEYLRCTVALPQRWQQISIEASDMRADPANPGLIALTATLRSNAKAEIGYPAIDVVLTNTLDHTLARRIFLPAEYLAAGKDIRGGIAPNAEFTVRLDLDTGDLGAAGFRIALLAAPAR